MPFLLQGYNLTCFAYGMTGSGKTFTMFGNDTHPGLCWLSVGSALTNTHRSTDCCSSPRAAIT